MTLAKRTEEPSGLGLLTKEGLAIQANQLKLLEEYVKTVLKENQDYGVIPGTRGTPTLLKPGAANVTAAFCAHAEPFMETEVVDPIKGYVFYRYRVDIISNAGAGLLARGFGSCTSMETKYRYRNALAKCPACGKENIRKDPAGAFYCWAKTGGCGANFHHDYQEIINQPAGRVENENPLEQANTILKMAIKRAEVDAAMRLPGVARFFTQDLEDMQATIEEPPQGKTPASPPQSAAAPTKGGSITDGFSFAAVAGKLGLTAQGVKEILGKPAYLWVKDGHTWQEAYDAVVAGRKDERGTE